MFEVYKDVNVVEKKGGTKVFIPDVWFAFKLLNNSKVDLAHKVSIPATNANRSGEL